MRFLIRPLEALLADVKAIGRALADGAGSGAASRHRLEQGPSVTPNPLRRARRTFAEDR
jgi:hypothetical protein